MWSSENANTYMYLQVGKPTLSFQVRAPTLASEWERQHLQVRSQYLKVRAVAEHALQTACLDRSFNTAACTNMTMSNSFGICVIDIDESQRYLLNFDESQPRGNVFLYLAILAPRSWYYYHRALLSHCRANPTAQVTPIESYYISFHLHMLFLGKNKNLQVRPLVYENGARIRPIASLGSGFEGGYQ